MRQVIADALGIKAIAIGDGGVKRSYGIARRLDKALLTEKLMGSLPPHRAASLLIAATVLAGTSASETQAQYVEPRAPVQLAQAATSDPGASQGVPEQELNRAETMARGLAAARRDLESVLTLLSKARDESARIRGASENEDAQRREALQQEREQASRLEQELAAARRDIEAQAARADKAVAEADQLKQAAKDEPAELRNSLQQERERAGRLEQALALAQRDVETQTALAAKAAKAAEETARDKQAAESTSAELQKSLQQERAKAEALTKEVTDARGRLLVQEAQARKAGEEAAGLKQAAEGTAELRQSLSQERERADRLEQALAAAQRDVETQTAQAAKAAEAMARDRQAAESTSAGLQKSLQQERDRAEALTQEVSKARAALFAYEAQARKAGEEAAKLKQAEGTAQLRQSLSQERERAGRLEQALAAARRDLETQAAQAAKAAEETARLKQAAEGTTELRKSLQQERDKVEAMAKEVSAARSEKVSAEAQAQKTSEQLAELKQAAEGTAELRKSLQRERERADRLEQGFATAQHDLEMQTALAAKTREEAARAKQAAESGSAELEKSLQQARERSGRLERELASARSTKEVSAAPQVLSGQLTPGQPGEAQAAAPVATVGETRGGAQANPADTAEVARLMARANMLLGQGDIGSARIVLERAADTGSAQASFALAETYDPLVLPKWGTYGTRGDASKAQTLYAKAQAGGIKEAKERFEALRR